LKKEGGNQGKRPLSSGAGRHKNREGSTVKGKEHGCPEKNRTTETFARRQHRESYQSHKKRQENSERPKWTPPPHTGP